MTSPVVLAKAKKAGVANIWHGLSWDSIFLLKEYSKVFEGKELLAGVSMKLETYHRD